MPYPPQRLRRFFVEVDGSYRINKSLREMCVFASHNVLADPPFSRVDLVSCRNLLIYLETASQRRVVPLLHYALKPRGFLVLGGSETIGTYRDLFEVENARHRIYRRKPSTRQIPIRPVSDTRSRRSEAPDRLRKEIGDADVQKEADRILLAKYAPPGVLVDAELEILQFRGDTGSYLAPAPGKASLSLLKMVREGLLVPLQAALLQAKKNGSPGRQEGLRVKSNGGYRPLDLEVIPVKTNPAREIGFLVLFKEAAGDGQPELGKAQAETGASGIAAEPVAQEVSRLTEELAVTREYLQSVIERRGAVGKRGAAKHQRGAGDLQGRSPVDQRRARHGQRRAAEPQPRARADQQ
jgi:two-component system CheB/CheR fusion protein